MTRRRKKLYCIFIVFVILLSTGCGRQKEKTITGFYFDTVISATIYTDDDNLPAEILKLCEKYEQMMSRTREGSDVWNMNHSGGKRIKVSDDTLEVLKKAIDYAKLTDGKFDITIAPVSNLWDFTADMPKIPDSSSLKAAVGLVDYTKIDINENGVLIPDGMSVDLGGIAKGYITDRVADFLKSRDVKNGLLNFGGNVYTIGKRPDGKPWRIGIKDPKDSAQNVLGSVSVTDTAVVTSGIYERGFTLDGVRYHHILDAFTGWPVENGLASVTILASRSDDADALSTSCFILGLQDGMQYIESIPGIEAIFIDTENQIYTTSGLNKIFEKAE